MMKRFLLTILLSAGLTLPAGAQRYSVGTNAVDWIALGTLNAEASAAVSPKVSLHAGAALNPWTFRAGKPESQMQMRHNSYWGGLRWWPWHVYSGWWAGASLRYSVYNGGGVLSRESEEGDAFGMGLWGGYSVMLSSLWNLDLGLGAWGGWKKYTRYACPVCGLTLETGEKLFWLPDARIAIQLIF